MFLQTLTLQRKIGSKTGRRVTKIEVPQTHLQSLSWVTRQQIYSGGGRR